MWKDCGICVFLGVASYPDVSDSLVPSPAPTAAAARSGRLLHLDPAAEGPDRRRPAAGAAGAQLAFPARPRGELPAAGRPRPRRPRQPGLRGALLARGQGARAGRRGGRRPDRRAHPVQPQVPLPELRGGQLQPVRPRRRPRRRRSAFAELQPALPLRRGGARQDPPAARHRHPHRAAAPPAAGALPGGRAVRQRAHQLHPLRPHAGLPRALPDDRRAAHRRRPVPRQQGADAGGVLPHLQHPLHQPEADHPVLGLLAAQHPDPRGAPAQPLSSGG